MELQSFIFYDDNQASAGDEFTIVESGKELCIQIDVEDGVVFIAEIEGKVFDDCEWKAIQVVDITTFESNNVISTGGIYVFSVCGLERVRVVVESISGGGIIAKGKVYS